MFSIGHVQNFVVWWRVNLDFDGDEISLCSRVYLKLDIVGINTEFFAWLIFVYVRIILWSQPFEQWQQLCRLFLLLLLLRVGCMIRMTLRVQSDLEFTLSDIFFIFVMKSDLKFELLV